MRGGLASVESSARVAAAGDESAVEGRSVPEEAPLRVAWFSHRADLAGAELGLVDACRSLRAHNMSITVVVPEEGPLLERLAGEQIPTVVAPFGWWMSAKGETRWRVRNLLGLTDIRTWRRLLRELDAIDPDLVVTNTSTIAAGAVAARIRRTPHVWYVREFGADDHDLYFDLGRRVSYRAIGRLSESVIAVSHAIGRHLERYGLGHKVRYVPYGWDVPVDIDPAPRDSNGLLLVQVGTITPKKGQQDAVRAIRVLRERGIDARLRLQGAAGVKCADHIRALARDEGVADRVEINAFWDPFPTLAAADVVLTCSRREAFGRTTLEAMKLGKPVVGTNTGGTPELIRDGWNGYLYTPGDVVALADRIARFHENPDLLETFGKNGRERARTEFSHEHYGAELASVFRAACRRAVAAPPR